jgi:uncharacterized protein (DUF2236 family)
MRIAQQINRERVVVLGWGRAVLMQLAHPLVAAGVDQHSGFAGGRLARLRRLRSTVGAMVELTFGDDARRSSAVDRINGIHRRVNGVLAEPVGSFDAGTPYAATDPQLLLWVHATLLDSVTLAYERFVGPLSTAQKDRYCEESLPVALRLGIPGPAAVRSARDLAGHIDAMLAGPSIHVGPAACSVARQLLYPPLSDPTRPAAWLTRLVTLGLLPPALRDAYGFPWSGARERSLRLVSAASRASLPFLPALLRYWRVTSLS